MAWVLLQGLCRVGPNPGYDSPKPAAEAELSHRAGNVRGRWLRFCRFRSRVRSFAGAAGLWRIPRRGDLGESRPRHRPPVPLDGSSGIGAAKKESPYLPLGSLGRQENPERASSDEGDRDRRRGGPVEAAGLRGEPAATGRRAE